MKEEEGRHRGGGRSREERRFLDRERILLTVARARSFVGGRVGGPANNAGLVFLNSRTNRHLRGERCRVTLHVAHSSRCSRRAHLSLFLFSYSREERFAARRKRSHGPWWARAHSRPRTPILSNELSSLPDRGTPHCALLPAADRPQEKTSRQGSRDIGPTLLFGRFRIRRAPRPLYVGTASGSTGYRNYNPPAVFNLQPISTCTVTHARTRGN